MQPARASSRRALSSPESSLQIEKSALSQEKQKRQIEFPVNISVPEKHFIFLSSLQDFALWTKLPGLNFSFLLHIIAPCHMTRSKSNYGRRWWTSKDHFSVRRDDEKHYYQASWSGGRGRGYISALCLSIPDLPDTMANLVPFCHVFHF